MCRLEYLLIVVGVVCLVEGKSVNKRKCPEVRPVPHFDLSLMLGKWFVVQYYDSDVEALSYRCMQSVLVQDDHVVGPDGKVEYTPAVSMKYTYQYIDDPRLDVLQGNITWKIDLADPAHWTHTEEDYNDIYNTFVTDVVYDDWALLLHCAEEDKDKQAGGRYLTAFMLSRSRTLPKNVLAYLTDKLKRYDVDVNYVFPVAHDEECEAARSSAPPAPPAVQPDPAPHRTAPRYRVDGDRE